MATSTNTYRSRQILAVATIPALVTGALLFYLALVNDPVSYTHLTLPTNREV